MKTEEIKLCAWCNQKIKMPGQDWEQITPDHPYPVTELISHGICHTCNEKLIQELKTETDTRTGTSR